MPIPNPDPTLEEMRRFLNMFLLFEPEENHDFEREEAIYWFAANYHGGQSSNLYSALSMSEFKPGPLSNGPANSLSQDLYSQLEQSYA